MPELQSARGRCGYLDHLSSDAFAAALQRRFARAAGDGSGGVPQLVPLVFFGTAEHQFEEQSVALETSLGCLWPLGARKLR